MTDILQPGQNTGFLPVEPKLNSDFIAGGETGVLSTPVLPSCDWRPFLPANVTQLMKTSDGVSRGDTNACVSFAGKQSVETQLNFQIANNLISPENLQWLKDNGYLDANGKVLLSARFTAKMSGTNPATGNSLPNVWGSLHGDGAVPEIVWPMPTADFDKIIAAYQWSVNQSDLLQKLWASYYADIPQSVKDLGKEFAARFPVLYEWMIYPAAPASGALARQYLDVSPLEIATAVCNGWNTDDPIKACGPGTQHATLMISVEANGVYDILDHYNPYVKQFAADYNITYGMRGVVGQGLPLPPVVFHYVFKNQLRYGASWNNPDDLKALQQALQFLKSPATGKPYMKSGVFGPFGPQTKTALGQFQTDHGIKDADGQGTNFGPQSRTAMNAELAKNQ